MNFDQAVLGGARSGIFNGARGEDSGFFGCAFEDGVTGGTEGGVESKDAHWKSVPSGVKLSREAIGHGLTLKKWGLIYAHEMDLDLLGFECAFFRGRTCTNQ